MNIKASMCREIAREELKGKWGKAVFTGFWAAVFGVFTSIITGVLKLILLSAILIFLCENVPHYRILTLVIVFLVAALWIYIGSFASLGYLNFNLAILDQRNYHQCGLFDATASWLDIIALKISVIFRSCFWGIFLVIPGIVTYYSYALAPFIMEGRKDITVDEALTLSKIKMKGHRFELFCLKFSFLGWRIIGLLTLGIGYLWINPYSALAETVFFNEVSGRAQELYDRE